MTAFKFSHVLFVISTDSLNPKIDLLVHFALENMNYHPSLGQATSYFTREINITLEV